MRKTTVLAVFFITTLSLLTLTACTKNQASSTNNNNNNGLARRPDFGQPDRQPDVSGIVTAITGNEVTLLKMERPQRNQDQDVSETEGEDNQPGSNNFRMNLNGSSVDRPGGGRFFAGGGPPGEQDADTRATMLERLKAMSSGEEKIIIPVGIQMLKPDTASDSGQPEMLEATLSDITTDKMIQVWLDESITDRKVAEFVMVMR